MAEVDVAAGRAQIGGGAVEQAFDLRGGECRAGRHHQRDHAGGDRGRERGARGRAVAAVAGGGPDAHARRRHGHIAAVAGPAGAGITAVGGRHRDHRRGGRRAVVAAAVARRNDQQAALAAQVLRRTLHRGAGIHAAEAGIGHARALVGGPGDAAGDGAVVGIAAAVGHAHRQDARAPGHAGHAGTVVADRRCRAGHRGAVAGDIGGVGAVVDEVPARQLLQVGVAGQNARIQDGDGHALALGGIPGAGGLDAPEVPLAAQVGVVDRQGGGHAAVQLDELQVRMLLQPGQHGGFRRARRELQHMQVAGAQPPRRATMGLERLGQFGRGQAGARHQQQAARCPAGILGQRWCAGREQAAGQHGAEGQAHGADGWGAGAVAACDGLRDHGRFPPTGGRPCHGREPARTGSPGRLRCTRAAWRNTRDSARVVWQSCRHGAGAL